MTKQELETEILELTRIIRNDRAALMSRYPTTANGALLHLAIVQRKARLVALRMLLVALP
jgi:hypothetical protein